MYSNKLTPSELERLALLAEEMGEALQIVGKTLRHGYEPEYCEIHAMHNNRTLLQKELGDVRAAMIRLCNAGDLSKKAIHEQADRKLADYSFLHFQ